MQNYDGCNEKCKFVFSNINKLLKQFLKNANFVKFEELSEIVSKSDTEPEKFKESADSFFKEIEQQILKCQASDKKEIKNTIKNLQNNSNKIINHINTINETSQKTIKEIQQAGTIRDLEISKKILNSALENFLEHSETTLTHIKNIKSQLTLKLQEVINLENEIEQIKNKMYVDELTGLMNRKGIKEIYTSILKNNQGEAPISEDCIMFIDIDNFKSVNDTFGHVAGDLIIKYVGQILKSILRDNDLIARIYGDEFLIIFRNTKIEIARAIAERVRKKIEKSVFYYKQKPIKITISSGLCRINKWNSFEETVESVDKLMYEAKQHGNRIVCL